MVLSPDNTAWDDLELRYLVSTDISHISQKMVTMATNRQLEILSYFFGRASSPDRIDETSSPLDRAL